MSYFYTLKKFYSYLFLGPSSSHSFRGNHLMAKCGKLFALLGLIRHWAVSFLLSSGFSSSPDAQKQSVHSTRSWGPVVGSPAPLSHPVRLCIPFISETHVPSFSSFLWVCSQLRPPAVPSLDNPFCTSLLTGGDLECACHSLKRLLVVWNRLGGSTGCRRC